MWRSSKSFSSWAALDCPPALFLFKSFPGNVASRIHIGRGHLIVVRKGDDPLVDDGFGFARNIDVDLDLLVGDELVGSFFFLFAGVESPSAIVRKRHGVSLFGHARLPSADDRFRRRVRGAARKQDRQDCERGVANGSGHHHKKTPFPVRDVGETIADGKH